MKNKKWPNAFHYYNFITKAKIMNSQIKNGTLKMKKYSFSLENGLKEIV